MSKVKVCFADTEELLMNRLARYFEQNELFLVDFKATEGESLLNYLLTHTPDLLILDFVLPKIDGFEILAYLESEPRFKNTVILLTPCIFNHRISQISSRFNVSFVIMKPYTFSNVMNKTNKMLDYKNRFNLSTPETLKESIKIILDDFTIKPTFHGYSYLVTAIKKVYQNQTLLEAVTKELYPSVGDLYNKKGGIIERSIRNALKRTWEEYPKKEDIIYNLSMEEVPTNTEFINHIVNQLK